MPFNPAPTALFGADYTGSSTDAALKISDFPELTAAEADGTTGDSRKMLYAILSKVELGVNALEAANKPSKMTISKSSTAPNALGVFRRSFSISFDVAIGSADVAAE